MIRRIRWWLRGLGVPIRLNEGEVREMLEVFRRCCAEVPMAMYGRSGIGSVPMPKEVARGTDDVR